MSADVDIRSGGLIAVDTDTLRHVAALLERAAADCAEVVDLLRRFAVASGRAGLLHPPFSGLATESESRAAGLARGLRERAALYEVVEQAAAGRMLGAADPALAAEARRLLERWRDDRHAEVDRQLTGAVDPLRPLGALLTMLTAAVRGSGLGVFRRGGDPRLHGHALPVRVAELGRREVAAPRSLEEVAARVPQEGDERVRVEIYDKPDGAREVMVYIAGTRHFGVASVDPWDMGSNVALYVGQGASSYVAVERALAAAGVRRGDRLFVAGHSQGAMIATHLARDPRHRVATVVTFASPVVAALDGGVLSVAVRHTDDPVVALAGGGLPTTVGSDESFVVERVADPEARLSDLAMGVHQMSAYTETAVLADRSGDPRVTALSTRLDEIGAGATGTAVSYGAVRVPLSDASSEGGG